MASAGGASGDGAPPWWTGHTPARRRHDGLAVDVGAEPRKAVADGIQAVHGVGEVGLELVDGGAMAHVATIHHQTTRRLSTPT